MQANKDVELFDQPAWGLGIPARFGEMLVEEFDILVGLHQALAEPRSSYEGHQFSDYVLWARRQAAGCDRSQENKPRCRHRPRAGQAVLHNIQQQLGGELRSASTPTASKPISGIWATPTRKMIGFHARRSGALAYIRRNCKPLTAGVHQHLDCGRLSDSAPSAPYLKASSRETQLLLVWPPHRQDRISSHD